MSLTLTKHEAEVAALYEKDLQQIFSYKRRRGEKPYNTWGFWDETTQSYDQALQEMINVVVERARIGPGDMVLDVGCGTGVSSLDIQATSGCASVTGIDLTQSNIDYGQTLVAEAGREDRVQLTRMSATRLSFPEDRFDATVAIDCACHFDTRAAFIQQAARVLKPGGRFLMLDLLEGEGKPSFIGRRLQKLMMQLWKIPEANRYGTATVVEHLSAAGLTDIQVEAVGAQMLTGSIRYMRTPDFRREYAVDFGRGGDLSWQAMLSGLDRVHRWGLADFYLVTASKPR